MQDYKSGEQDTSRTGYTTLFCCLVEVSAELSNLLVFLIFMEGQQRIKCRSAHRVFRMRTGTLVRKFEEGLSSGHSMLTHFKTQCDVMEKLAQACHVSLVPNAE